MGCGDSREKETEYVIDSYKSFFDAIAKGKKLVVLEDKVLDVGKFAAVHPGGPKMMTRYVGIHF